MRLLLSLSAPPGTVVPAHYNYQLSAAVYNLLHFGSADFAAYLHDIGFQLRGKSYKLFTFALRFKKTEFGNNVIRLLSPHAYLHVSSPLAEDFIHNFVLGTFGQQRLRVGPAEFDIERIETQPDPEFTDAMSFTLLSPLVLSTRREHKGRMQQYYLRPEDRNDIDRVLTSNLTAKYELLTGSKLTGGWVELDWNSRYMERHQRVTRRVTINEGGRAIDVIGIQAPFTLRGTPELIRVGYECGYGEKNSTGFGMARVG